MGDVNLGRLFVTLEGQDIGLKRMLTEARTEMTRFGATGRQLQSDLSPEAYLGAFKSGLIGIVGPAAIASVAIGAVTATVSSFRDAFNFKTQLDESTRSIELQLKGVRDSGQAFAQAKQFAQDYKLTQQQTTEAIAASLPIIRQSNESIYNIIGTLSRLQILKPEKSIQDAARALSELKNGQVESIVEQFNISRSSANKMKQEIEGGADAVLVLSKYLVSAGAGMDALAARTTGASGKMRDLAIAQEQLKQAQAEWAQGPGMAILDVQTRAVTGLTRVLGGGGGLSEAFRQVGAEWSQMLTYGAAFNNAMAEGKTKAEAMAIGQRAAAEAIMQTGTAWQSGGGAMVQTTQAIDGATQNLNSVLSEALQKQIDNTNAANELSAAQATLASLGNAVAQGLMTDAAAAAAMASQYNLATNAALALVQAQAAVERQKLNKEALMDQRRGERGDERTTLEFTRDEHFRSQAVQAERQHQATRVGNVGKFNNQMLGLQDKYQDSSESQERDHQRRLTDIEADGQRHRLEQERRNEVSKRTSRADFYDNLSGSGVDPAQFSAQYEEAYAKAQQIAQEGNAKLSEEYLAMRQRQIEADQQYAREASEVASDDGLSKDEKARRQAAIEERRQLRQEANAEEEKQLMEQGDAIKNEQQRQLDEEGQRYAEATAEAGQKFDDLADRRITAYQRANAVIADIPPAELAQAKRTGQATGAPAATATPKTNDVLAVRDDAVVGAIGAQTGELKEALEGVRRAVDGVERAVQSLNTGSAVQ